MAKASEAYPWQLVLINEWPIDCTLTESHDYESEITEFPVESGSVISDNVRLQPLMIRLECIVSNTPIGEIVSNVNQQFGVPEDESFSAPLNKLRSTVIYQRLIEMRDKRDVITVRTSRGVFDNMLIKSLSIPRDDKTGDAIKFSLTVQQVKLVSNDRGKRAAIPNTGGGTKGLRTVSKMTIEGTRVTAIIAEGNVWFDPDIGVFRFHFIKRASVFDASAEGSKAEAETDRSDNDLAFTYIKGPMLDGFMGTDAQCRAHYKSVLDNALQNPKAWERVSIKGHEPFKSHSGTSSKNLSGENLGRITKIDGTPGLPSYDPPTTQKLGSFGRPH